MNTGLWMLLIGIGVVIISFGVSRFMVRHESDSLERSNNIGEVAAILSVLIWGVLIFLMVEGIIKP
jgi:drug/metabolite transporter (DMT)-like permease